MRSVLLHQFGGDWLHDVVDVHWYTPGETPIRTTPGLSPITWLGNANSASRNPTVRPAASATRSTVRVATRTAAAVCRPGSAGKTRGVSDPRAWPTPEQVLAALDQAGHLLDEPSAAVLG